MSPNVVLVVVTGCLYATGIYLLLDRSLTRVLLGILLLGNATNLLLLSAGGAAGGPPLVGVTPPEEMSDPLPQALILTAIVITMGIAAFVLSMIHRSWRLGRQENVEVDVADREVASRRSLREQDSDDEADEVERTAG